MGLSLSLYKIIFAWAGGSPCFKWNSAKISVEFQVFEYFLKFRVHDRSGWIIRNFECYYDSRIPSLGCLNPLNPKRDEIMYL